MKKEDFVAAVAHQKEIIDKAKGAINELKANYAESAPHFNIGDKIIISSIENTKYNWHSGKDEIIPASKRFAFVVYCELKDNGYFSYGLRKCKKDGTQSEMSDYLSNGDVIEAPI